MSYTNEDLDAFQLLRAKEQLNGTAYFELHPGEPPEPFACWLDGSLFIKDAGFDFFVECFYAAHEAFDYFAFERFDASQIDALIRHLSVFTAELTVGCGREVVFTKYNSLFSRRIWDSVETEALRSAVAEAGGGLCTFLRTIQSER